MSFNEEISFDDELAQYQAGIDEDSDGVPEPIETEESLSAVLVS